MNAAGMIEENLNLAIMFARKAVKANPQETLAIETLAEAYRRRRWLDDAQLEADKLLAVAPADPKALLVRAHVALDQKRSTEALEFAGKIDRSKLDAAGVTRLDRIVADATAAKAATVTRPVFVYSAPWCGYCRQVKAWLTKRGTPFIERDVDNDDGASRELTQKCATYGIRRGSIPVTDVDGELVVGADFEKLTRVLR